VSLRKRLRTLVACLVLEFGALCGLPTRMEQLEELLRALNAPKAAHSDPQEEENSDGGRS